MENKNLKIQFANNLKKIRKSRNLTQEELSELVGVDFRYISLLENAKNFPSSDLIEKLSDALRVSISELFDFDEDLKREVLEKSLKNILPILSDEKLKLLLKFAKDLTYLN